MVKASGSTMVSLKEEETKKKYCRSEISIVKFADSEDVICASPFGYDNGDRYSDDLDW